MGKYYHIGNGTAAVSEHLIDINQAFYSATESFFYNYGSSKGGVTGLQLLGYAASGFASSVVGDLVEAVTGEYLTDERLNRLSIYDKKAFGINASGLVSDLFANTFNYYIGNNYKGGLSKISIGDVFDWNSAGKNYLKSVLYSGGKYGFNTTGLRIMNRAFGVMDRFLGFTGLNFSLPDF